MPDTTDEAIDSLLDAGTVAVVGCSSTPGKDAHEIPKYLLDAGYDVVPVNPYADEIFGRPAHDRLGDVERDVDVVDVFRPSDEVAGIVDQVVDRRADRGDVWGLWLQLGIRDDGAAARAESAGVTVVQDRCMKVEHRRIRD